MKIILKRIGFPMLVVTLLSACGSTESTETTTKSTRMDSVATEVIDSVTSPISTTPGSATN